MPVISRSGSTSLSVTRMSPSFFIHSMALRKSLTSSGGAPSLFAFAIAFLRIFYVILPSLRARKNKHSAYQLERFKTQSDNGYAGEFSDSGRLDGVNAYTTIVSMSTNASTVGRRSRPGLRGEFGDGAAH